MAMKKRKFRSAALQWIYDRYIGKDRKRVEEYEQEVQAKSFALEIRGILGLVGGAGLSACRRLSCRRCSKPGRSPAAG